MEQCLTLQQQQPQDLQQQQQQPADTLQILDLSNVENYLTGTGVGDPMAHPEQAALIQQPQRLTQLQQLQQQQPQQQQQEAVVLDPSLYNLIEETLAAQGVDDPSALPFPL